MTEPSLTVLIVEDERAIRRFLRPALEGEGYRVLEAEDQRSGMSMASSHTPDLIILDLGLPDRNGLELIRAVREWSAMPIIIVSARGQETDKVKALDLGADDYLTKPFSVQELLARVRAALRRSTSVRDAVNGSPIFTVGDLVINLAKRRVTLATEPVGLTPLEFKLLAELAKHPGRVLTHQTLLVAVWGPGRAHEPHLVRVHMANLRRKLEADTARPRYLLTELSVGYRLADE
ncbi:MAG: response regulator [Phycisphaerales bacterium]|nr:MAG: response regulator [Phycisphaerales bacterium]